jgi:L-threonylcarbamoyladenylate synthase
MEIASANDSTAASKAAQILHLGGVVLYPTDTLYGLGTDALSNEAVAKIYMIKGRDEGKPIHAIVSDLAMAERYGEINDTVRTLVGVLPKGRVTFIVKKKSQINTGIAKDITTFGFRIPDNDFCIEMIRAFAAPITATSANKAGEIPQRSLGKILSQLGSSIGGIDCAFDGGELTESKPSTVVDCTNAKPTILREGVVPAIDVWKVLDLRAS